MAAKLAGLVASSCTCALKEDAALQLPRRHAWRRLQTWKRELEAFIGTHASTGQPPLPPALPASWPALPLNESSLQPGWCVAADSPRGTDARRCHLKTPPAQTGRPNVDWCEDHKQEVLKVNVQGVLNVLHAAHKRGVHCTYFGTGCIYTYDAQHPQAAGKGFTEADSPNFRGSWYSHTKAMVEEALPAFPNTLTLRLRMPLSDDLHPRSLLTKLTKYEKVVNIPNSVSVLHDLLPVAVHLVQQGSTGTFNFTNPGTVTHNFILQQYQQVVDPAFTWTNFSEEEQSRILKAPRSNTELDVTKLLCAAKPLTIPPADESVKSLMHRLHLSIQVAS